MLLLPACVRGGRCWRAWRGRPAGPRPACGPVLGRAGRAGGQAGGRGLCLADLADDGETRPQPVARGLQHPRPAPAPAAEYYLVMRSPAPALLLVTCPAGHLWTRVAGCHVAARRNCPGSPCHAPRTGSWWPDQGRDRDQRW